MATSLKAIETQYKGYRFRSRLEARWAVFCDVLGLRYEYEPEGFDLDGTWYLPDFKATHGVIACPPDFVDEEWAVMEWNPSDCEDWIEVKPAGAIEDEAIRRADLLAEASGRRVYLLAGEPYEGAYAARVCYGSQYGLRSARMRYLWSECPVCGTVDLQQDAGVIGCSTEDDGYCYPMFQCIHCDVHARSGAEPSDIRWHKGMWIVLRDGWRATTGRRLAAAYTAARGARFEYGESGPRR